MSFSSSFLATFAQIVALVGAALLCARPLGFYVARVLAGEKTFLAPILGPLEKAFYVFCGVSADDGMTAAEYCKSLLVFSFVCGVGLFVALVQAQDIPVVTAPMAFNIASSFLTGTNWQSYVPETTVTNATQQFGLTVLNFLAAAVGLAVFAALARALGKKDGSGTLGNFWADMTRGVLYVFLPLSVLFAFFLIAQGVVQTFSSSVCVYALEDGAQSVLLTGPVASQVAIKQLGTNGGGFYAANAAHPFENPTPLSNFSQMLALLLVPAALTMAFGKMVGNVRQGGMLLAVMTVLFVPTLFATSAFEQKGNPLLASFGIDAFALGNMEGKEVRFGAIDSALFATTAGASAGGSLNASLDSFMPLGSLVPLAHIHLGEVVFGGIGLGLCGMLVYVFLTVFVAGLMIGRTPEYLGKKIGVFETKMIALILLTPVFLTLFGTACAVASEAGRLGATNPGAQGFSQILYAFSSASNANGSAFGGVAAGGDFYAVGLGLCMLLGRFVPILAFLGLAGSFARQAPLAATSGTLRTDTFLFAFFLVSLIVLTGVLSYTPALMLGPGAEHVFTFLEKGGS